MIDSDDLDVSEEDHDNSSDVNEDDAQLVEGHGLLPGLNRAAAYNIHTARDDEYSTSSEDGEAHQVVRTRLFPPVPDVDTSEDEEAVAVQPDQEEIDDDENPVADSPVPNIYVVSQRNQSRASRDGSSTRNTSSSKKKQTQPQLLPKKRSHGEPSFGSASVTGPSHRPAVSSSRRGPPYSSTDTVFNYLASKLDDHDNSSISKNNMDMRMAQIEESKAGWRR